MQDSAEDGVHIHMSNVSSQEARQHRFFLNHLKIHTLKKKVIE